MVLIVDWDGLPVCCEFESFMDDVTYVRDVEDCVEYDLLHTGVNLLWLSEFWIGISAR